MGTSGRYRQESESSEFAVTGVKRAGKFLCTFVGITRHLTLPQASNRYRSPLGSAEILRPERHHVPMSSTPETTEFFRPGTSKRSSFGFVRWSPCDGARWAGGARGVQVTSGCSWTTLHMHLPSSVGDSVVREVGKRTVWSPRPGVDGREEASRGVRGRDSHMEEPVLRIEPSWWPTLGA